MPVQPTYPGVYIEEIDSGARPITSVPTSVTAFVGRTARGPIHLAVHVRSLGDFERRFGGLFADAPMTYAVRDFFQNGGTDALVVRLFERARSASGVARLRVGGLRLVASSPGAWGNRLTATVDHDGIDASVAKHFGVPAASLFNLTIAYDDVGRTMTERVRHVSIRSGSRRGVARVLDAESALVRAARSSPGPIRRPPDGATGKGTGGDDGAALDPRSFRGDPKARTGLFALDRAGIVNVLCIPPDRHDADVAPAVWRNALDYCRKRRAFLIVDAPLGWGTELGLDAAVARQRVATLGLGGEKARDAAIYFPRVRAIDPLSDGRIGTFAPCGIVAGIVARNDVTRGVWKAPAGRDLEIHGVEDLTLHVDDARNAVLNAAAVNCLRSFPPESAPVVWGARTMRGDDSLADDFKWLPVRRTFLFIEESLDRGLQWVVFEPNDEPLWARIRETVDAFLQLLFRQGAFQGPTPRDAYFVKCGPETTTRAEIDRGIINVVVGFAPLLVGLAPPGTAEFVTLKIRKRARRGDRR